MFLLKFRKSKSKYYAEAEKLAVNFDEHCFENNTHMIDLSLKEIFEKWDFFNLLFWKVVDWKGTSFGYEEFNVQSHSDKTRLFYALQWAHSTWINMSEDYLKNIAPAYYDENFTSYAKAIVMKDYELSDFESLIEKALKLHGER
ncbi:MAG: hypothetical protein GX102_04770 [Porphyromonadaceae bacterium]|jgi:hypothetical protein|nr:hypothetical protein [Porphyromonadaceae bacterium]